MKLLILALPIFSLTIAQSTVAADSTVHSNVLNVNGCQQGPYGGIVDCHWRVGANLERKSDFAGAQLEYQKALQVSQGLKDQTLRDCAVLSSQARVAALDAVARYFQKNGTGPEAIGVAHDISRLAFVQTLEQSTRTRPDLANKCP
jgi:hypothetical protein